MSYKMSQEEADLLIAMAKHYIENKLMDFPQMKKGLEFEVIGEKREDKFIVNIDDKRIVEQFPKMTYQGRVKSDNTILMRLDVGGPPHQNPDGEKVGCPHLHIYKEGYDDRYAIPFDIENKNLFELCYIFFDRFNIIKKPELQLELEMNQ